MAPLRPYGLLEADPPTGIAADASPTEARRVLMASEGPAPLAVALHGELRRRHLEATVRDLFGGTAVGGNFEVRHGRRRVRVVLAWTTAPSRGHRCWMLSLSPVHRRRRRRATEDLTLVAELLPHVDEVLAELPQVTDRCWMSEDEARATEL